MPKITAEVAKERLERFTGKPKFLGGSGTTEGLKEEEMLELFQYLIDTGEVYNMTDGTQYNVQAWAEEGHLTGFDASKMKS